MAHRIESDTSTAIKFYGPVRFDDPWLFAHRWVCDECNRKGFWQTSKNEAIKSGTQHDVTKNHIGSA